jgi:hypothetical protein
MAAPVAKRMQVEPGRKVPAMEDSRDVARPRPSAVAGARGGKPS